MSIIIATILGTLDKTASPLIEDYIKSIKNPRQKNHKGKTYTKKKDNVEAVVKVEVIYQIEYIRHWKIRQSIKMTSTQSHLYLGLLRPLFE